jgi:hypothetical protein
MSARRGNLQAVPPADKPDMAGDIYADGRTKREDREHWARVLIDADRRNLPRGWFRP